MRPTPDLHLFVVWAGSGVSKFTELGMRRLGCEHGVRVCAVDPHPAPLHCTHALARSIDPCRSEAAIVRAISNLFLHRSEPLFGSS